METLSEIRSVVQSDLNVGTNSSLFPTTRIDSAINRAYIKVSRLFRWDMLEDAKKTSTAVNQEYYDFPQNWQPDSIWRVEVDGVVYGESPDGSPMTFKDYLLWKTDNTGSTDKKWTVQWRRYFVYPVPTAVGDDNITIYGLKNVTKLTEDTDTTIFSYNSPECNEAIALEATEILKRKGESSKQLFSGEAKQILIVSNNALKKQQNKYEKVQPFLNVPDMFAKGRSRRQNTGNF